MLGLMSAREGVFLELERTVGVAEKGRSPPTVVGRMARRACRDSIFSAVFGGLRMMFVLSVEIEVSQDRCEVEVVVLVECDKRVTVTNAVGFSSADGCIRFVEV